MAQAANVSDRPTSERRAALATKSAPARLITLPLSHFCEKARWGLDRTGIAYIEEPHLPLLHRLHTARIGGGSVPLLVTPKGVLTNSSAILHWAHEHRRANPLFPEEPHLANEVTEIEQYCDALLGPEARRYAYGQLLPERQLLSQHFGRGTPLTERLLAPMILRLVRMLIRRAYAVTPDRIRYSLHSCREVFARVSDRLADGRRYLVGGRFTAADLTFAALAAPLLLPEHYGGSIPRVDEVPEDMRLEVVAFRSTRAGGFALEMYQQHRTCEAVEAYSD